MSKKNVPEIRFKRFTESWKPRKLGSILHLENGYAFKSRFFQKEPSNVIVLTPGSVHIGGGFQEGKGQFYDKCVDVPPKFIFKPNDLFVTMTDLTPSAQALGFPALVPNDGNTYLHNQRLGKLTNFEMDRLFLFQLLCTEQSHKKIVLSSSGTTVKHSSPQKILDCEHFIPTREDEQKEIGITLQNIDHLIALHSEKHRKLLNVKKAMLEKMFPKDGESVPEIRFTGFTKPWTRKSMQDFGDFKNGMNFGKEALGHGYPFVNLQDVFGRSFVIGDSLGLAESNDTQRKTYDLRSGDVLFIRSSVKPEGVGETAVIYNDLINTTYSGFIIRFRANIKMSPRYSRFAYTIKPVRKQILAGATSSANTNINQDSLSKVIVYLPEFDEQEKIGTYFENLDSLISLQREELEKLKNIKKAMLEKMFV